MTKKEFARRFSLDNWQQLCGHGPFLDAVEAKEYAAAEVVAHNFLNKQSVSSKKEERFLA